MGDPPAQSIPTLLTGYRVRLLRLPLRTVPRQFQESLVFLILFSDVQRCLSYLVPGIYVLTLPQ
jgi:hypothetical protein